MKSVLDIEYRNSEYTEGNIKFLVKDFWTGSQTQSKFSLKAVQLCWNIDQANYISRTRFSKINAFIKKHPGK